MAEFQRPSPILSMRPFLPAKDFAQSKAFYEALGFRSYPIGDKLVQMQLGDEPDQFAFLLQDFYVKEFAENLMMHLMVEDIDRWWKHIESLDLAKNFGVGKPRPPNKEPWGLTVSYVFDPCGVLWHVASETK